MKLTEWFPEDVEPAYPGVYEKDFGEAEPEYQCWDGKRWYYGRRTTRGTLSAFVNDMDDDVPFPRRWRGVV